MKLICRKSEWMDDWYVIERAEHDGKEWLEQTGKNGFSFQTSSRFSDADVEGNAKEMLAIAKAIREKGRISFKRCSVKADAEPVLFCSPRNSQEDGECRYQEAVQLAEQIERDVKP